ncbi:hypothetical protein A0J61_09907 [Choanephora cucurbitarum]|uniref:Uncharacterized protein n=1 Tax=Choanephora cucurbitarum TaxID=101091 RepID=A0A1C7MYZ7_9FUNG|nr:hypothetical protein A0J61_09907 [Choanephora cucurbitarum]
MLLHSLVSFFQPHKKNKTAEKEVVRTIPPPPPPIPSSYLENNPSTSSVSEFPSHSIHQKVEFEQSRNLLQLDFFNKVDYNQIASFPKFDHLLASPSSNSTPPPPLSETQPEPQSTLTSLNRRLTTTLKHRISINRSHRDKAVKKAASTPNFHNTQKK